MGHLYELRNSARYRTQRVVLPKTRPTKAVTIGLRKAPTPEGRPGCVGIGNVHQGDWDGAKGSHHINAVGCVTPWQVSLQWKAATCPCRQNRSSSMLVMTATGAS